MKFVKYRLRRWIAILPVLLAVIWSVSTLETQRQAERVEPAPTPCPLTLTLDAPEQTSVEHITPDATDVDMLARLIWGEGRGVSETEKAAIVWCVLNRVEDGRWPGTVAEVVTQPGQFEGYSPEYPSTQEHREIAERVLSDWLAGDDSRRALPREYVFFTGDGKRNRFRTEFRGGDNMTFEERTRPR